MIARGGRVFVGASAVAAIVLVPFQIYGAIALACFAGFLAVVFRDPRRSIGTGAVAAADGRIREVRPGEGFVSTYLALRNVHVTRAPLAGTIEKASIIRGKHAPAFSKGTPMNERLELTIRTESGDIRMVQMVGALARRIVPYVKEGQTVVKGEKLSLIRFGSRVDVYVPPSVKLTVSEGLRTTAGRTTIGEVKNGSVE